MFPSRPLPVLSASSAFAQAYSARRNVSFTIPGTFHLHHNSRNPFHSRTKSIPENPYTTAVHHNQMTLFARGTPRMYAVEGCRAAAALCDRAGLEMAQVFN